jgi:CRP-like cAMP-binding protein/CheY-like chemotaxis protein
MKRKILLIEDNLEMRENTTEILELADYNVVSASNGREGVEMASKELPDLIICDIMMPILDGYGVLGELSKNENTAGIPFIFLTAKAERVDQRKGMEMGADDYLTKPFDDLELLNAVNTRLRKSDVLKRNFSRDLNGLNDFMEAVKGLDTLNKLSTTKALKAYKKKENIYLEGNIPRGIYFINSGKVKTSITNPDGKDLITGLYDTGDFFGYLALLEETKYTDTASALEDAEICMIPKEDFYGLVYNSPDVSKKFIKMLSNELATKEDQLLQLAYNSVRKRVAEALMSLYNKYGQQKQENFSMKISREDLSNLVGTSTETVIRTLSDFKDENLVELKGGLITIIDPTKLSGMKN